MKQQKQEKKFQSAYNQYLNLYNMSYIVKDKYPPIRTFSFRLCQFSFTVAVCLFIIGAIGIDSYFDYSIRLPFKSSLFSFHSAMIEIMASILLIFQCVYIEEEEVKRHRENYKSPEELRDIQEKKEIKKFERQENI